MNAELLTELEAAWRINPELRLGQLVRNAVLHQRGEGDDPGPVEDAELLDALRGYRASKPEAPTLPGPYWDTRTTGSGSFLKGRPRDPGRIEGCITTLRSAWGRDEYESLSTLLLRASGRTPLHLIEDEELRGRLDSLGEE